MFLLKLAIVNIGRNPRRSVITVLAVAVGLAALIFLWGFSDGTTEQQRENVIRLFTGHVQIHAQGFDKNLSPELLIPDHEALIEKIKSRPGVKAVTERVKTEALVGTTQNSRGILLLGIDPEREPSVTDIKKYVRQGEFLSTGANREVLIGFRLADKIGAGIGDKVVIMTQALDGTLAGFAYRVKGIMKTGSLDLDELSVYVTIDAARELLGIEKQTHEIVVRLEGRKTIEPFLAGLKRDFDLAKLEVLTWDQIIPEVNQWATWSEAIIRTVLFTVMAVIGVGIMNTVLMSVFERIRELGVMLAIGTSPGQIMFLIFLETLVLELIGIGIGLIAGYAFVGYFGHVGIQFTGVEEAFSATYMSTVTYTKVETPHVIQSIFSLIAITSFIGLYPAWKAGRMEPVKAIYHSY